MYTVHINSVVKACADLLGFFVLYEHGRRTDAIIQTAAEKTIAMIEIEWTQPFRAKVNEIKKLLAAPDDTEAYIFIGYSDQKSHEKNLQAIKSQWTRQDRQLIALLITYDLVRDRRKLKTLETIVIRAGESDIIRTQPALPWCVRETRWSQPIDPSVSP